VEAGELRYSTQVTAANVRGAVRKLLGSGPTKRAIGRVYSKAWPASYSMRDVLQLVPVAGQLNTFLCGLGKKGKDASVAIVIVRTVARKYA
jgi:hypothetical protein